MAKPIPALKPAAALFGIAACSLAVAPGNELQLLPAGAFRGLDGRPFDAPGWNVDAALAQVLIDAANARKTPYVIDYEHQTLLAKENGKPAPAAGFFKQLEWREGVGLFATDVEWTENAAALIAAGEYRFVSPVIGYNKKTGAVTALYMAAITNNPSIDGMSDVLLASAALCFSTSSPTPLTEDISMDQLLQNLIWLLNLPVGATADDVLAQLQKLVSTIKEDATATAAASFDLTAFVAKSRESIASLSAQVPDPAKFVPIDVQTQLQAQVAALTSQLNDGRVEQLVGDALKAGKLLPVQEDWARAFGKSDLAALTAYLNSAPPMAILSGTQTGGRPPAGAKDGVASLTASQKELCRAMGVAEDEFLKTLQAENQAA